MKTYVLYHSNCPDGCGAALAAYLKFGEEAEYIPVNYGQPVPKIEPGSMVYIVDFCYPAIPLRELSEKSNTVVVLDHHATAQADLSRMEETNRLVIIFDMTKSGAVLAWEYFHPEKPVLKFILYLQDRDLWQWKLTESREVSAAIGSYPFDFREWAIWLKEAEDDQELVASLASEGMGCLRLKNQQVEIMAKNHRWAVFTLAVRSDAPIPAMANIVNKPQDGVIEGTNQFSVPCANATVFFSEVGEKLLEMFPTAPFAAYYFDRNDGRRQWGIRARKDFDAATLIAKPMGGGGHPQACGFTTPIP